MKNSIRIVINPDVDKVSFEFLNNYNNNYILEITLNPTTKYDDAIKNDALDKLFKSKEINKYDFLNNMDYTSFSFFNKYFDSVNENKIIMAVNNYLLINKETFRNKKIVLPETYNWHTNIADIKNKYKDYNKILLSVEGNIEPITIEEFEKSQIIYKSIINIIKEKNYSPLETSILIYDIVRNYHYQKQNKDESIFASRDISKILLENKIVCTGYANLTRLLLKEFNISSKIYRLKSHDLIMLYLKDDKYKIDGIYLSDPTAECNKGSDNYLYHYKYFLKTRDKMLDNYCYEKDETLLILDQKETKNLVEEAKIILESNDFYNKMQLKFTLDKLSYLVKGHNYISDDIQINSNIKEIEYFTKLLSNDITMEQFNKALQVVRQNKYYKEKSIAINENIAIKIADNSDFYSRITLKDKVINHPFIKKLTKNNN